MVEKQTGAVEFEDDAPAAEEEGVVADWLWLFGSGLLDVDDDAVDGGAPGHGADEEEEAWTRSRHGSYVLSEIGRAHV